MVMRGENKMKQHNDKKKRPFNMVMQQKETGNGSCQRLKILLKHDTKVKKKKMKFDLNSWKKVIQDNLSRRKLKTNYTNKETDHADNTKP